jgi:MYXO-CTERM domain-containing protein
MPPVTVVTQQVVGPYDSVTVRASQGEALGTWLRANGYEVPQSLQPVIDAFTSEGFDFIALKLAPNEGVQAMQPVRVITPGADPSLPLRMVAAGVGAHVGLELYVLSEGRYHPQNFPDATIDFTQLQWDPNQQISNYTTLAQQALAANAGRGWLTEMSGPANLGAGTGPSGNPSLDSAYASACTPQVLQPPPGCGATEAGAPEASTGAVDGAAHEGGGEAGEPGEGGEPSDGAVEASLEAGTDAAPPPPTDDAGIGGGPTCQPQMIPCDDLDLAMTGITPGNLWITRLRADLPVTALTDDLVLEAAPSQDPVPNFHQTTAYTVANYNPCSNQNQGSSSSSSSAPSPVGMCGCRTVDSAPLHTRDIALLAVAGLGAVLSIRRRRRV